MEWLGTGSAFSFSLGNTAFLVEASSRCLLVDCGATVPAALGKERIDRITDIVITHMHNDHIGGLELVGFYRYFANKTKAPRLHVSSEKFARTLWNQGLKAGMGLIRDSKGCKMRCALETFFAVRTGKTIRIPGFPVITLVPRLHVKGMENYGLRFSNGIYYSGDTLELPPNDNDIRCIFQDCQFSGPNPDDVHISYAELKSLPLEVRSRTWLVHLSSMDEASRVQMDGFAGCVAPGQVFEFGKTGAPSTVCPSTGS